MGNLIDCVVNYFGSIDADGLPRRYFSYHIIGGPGMTEEGGTASITPLAMHDNGLNCDVCQRFFVAIAGGPFAAVAKAVRYLDAYHRGDHLRKVQSKLQGPATTAPTSAR